MSLIRKHGAVLQAWACLDLVLLRIDLPPAFKMSALITRTCFESCTAVHSTC